MEPLAERFRSDTNITCIASGSLEHKILFADAVILMITNPSSSLKEVQKTLTWFSKVSYYKANYTKSYILDLGMDATLRNLL